GQPRLGGGRVIRLFLFQDGIADRYAFISDIRARMVSWGRNQFADSVLRLLAERTPQPFFGGLSSQEILPDLLVFVDNLIDNPVLAGLLGTHPEITFHIPLNLFHALASVLGHDFIKAGADAQDFTGVNIDVRSLAGKPAHRGLMN